MPYCRQEKSMKEKLEYIGRVFEDISGTIAANTAAILNGANIIRFHDINEGIDTAKIADFILKANI